MSGEQKYYKSITFDVNTKKLKELGINRSLAYGQIRRFFESNGFVHTQGSGYHSREPMRLNDVRAFNEKLYKALPWFGKCVKYSEATNVGKVYNLIEMHDEQGNQQMSPVKEHHPNRLELAMAQAHETFVKKEAERAEQRKQGLLPDKPVKRNKPKL